MKQSYKPQEIKSKYVKGIRTHIESKYYKIPITDKKSIEYLRETEFYLLNRVYQIKTSKTNTFIQIIGITFPVMTGLTAIFLQIIQYINPLIISIAWTVYLFILATYSIYLFYLDKKVKLDSKIYAGNIDLLNTALLNKYMKKK